MLDFLAYMQKMHAYYAAEAFRADNDMVAAAWSAKRDTAELFIIAYKEFNGMDDEPPL